MNFRRAAVPAAAALQDGTASKLSRPAWVRHVLRLGQPRAGLWEERVKSGLDTPTLRRIFVAKRLTMELYFLRHAKAAPRSGRSVQRDSERALTPDGEAKMWLIAQAMQNLGLKFDRILTSPLVRARRTAEIAAQALKLTSKLVLTNHLVPDGDRKALIIVSMIAKSLSHFAWTRKLANASTDASTNPGNGPSSATTARCHCGALKCLPPAAAPKNGMKNIRRSR